MNFFGYKINKNNNHIMIHEGTSFEVLKSKGFETGNDSFKTRQQALDHARNTIKKTPPTK